MKTEPGGHNSPITYGTLHAVLKPMSEVLLPDPRFQHLLITSAVTERAFTQEDLHLRLDEAALHQGVPERIRVQFETARNLMLYSWFVFEFHTVSEMHAYGALELALGEKLGHPTKKIFKNKKPKEVPLMLSELLQLAHEKGLFKPENMPAWGRVKAWREWYQLPDGASEGQEMTCSEWFGQIIKTIPSLRNGLAHGEPRLYLTASLRQLALCADLINDLYQRARRE